MKVKYRTFYRKDNGCIEGIGSPQHELECIRHWTTMPEKIAGALEICPEWDVVEVVYDHFTGEVL